MKSKTTIVRQNKEDNLLRAFNNLSFLIINFRSNHKWIDGRELKKVSVITTAMKDKILMYSSKTENDSTTPKDLDSIKTSQKGIKNSDQ